MRVPREKRHFKIDLNGTSYVYCYITKNACSSWKRLFMGESKFKKNLSEFVNPISFMGHYHGVKRTSDVKEFDRRIVILRDPLERVFSAYMNRVVRVFDSSSDLVVDVASACGKSPRDVTFKDFVTEYVCKYDDYEINDHFKSQASHLLDISYTHVWGLRDLYGCASREFGVSLADRYFKKSVNSTSHMSVDKSIPQDAKLGFLGEIFRSSGTIPSKEVFLSGDLVSALEEKYSEDYRIMKEML